MGSQTMPVAIGALAVCQLVGAVLVMRAASARPDLMGMQRIIPAVIALFVPVIGPFIGSRATDAGMPPVAVSALGALLAGGLFILGGRGAPPPRPPAQAGAAQPGTEGGTAAEGETAAEGDTGSEGETAATGDASTEAETAAASETPTEGEATAGEGEGAATTTDSAPDAPVAEPPEEEPTAAAPAEPEAPPEVEVEVRPVASTATQPETATPTPEPEVVPPVPELLSPPTPAVRPVISSRVVLAEAQLRLPGPKGFEVPFEQVLSGPAAKGLGLARLQFGVALTSPPPGRSGPRQLFLGGRILDYEQMVTDRFLPYGVSISSLMAGQTIPMRTIRGFYEAEVRVAEVEKSDEQTLVSAVLDVRFR